MNNVSTITKSVGTDTTSHAVVISTPKKSRYQFYVKTRTKALVDIIERELPKTGRTLGDILTFNTNHPYKGMFGFNLPGGFTGRKCMANTLFKMGWKWAVLVELNSGGLRPIINRYDHTGSTEKINTGGCLGCNNKDYKQCLGCPDNFQYINGIKKYKATFHNHTNRR